MELTIIWFIATIVAIIAFIFALVSYVKVSDLEKQVDEIEEWLDTLTDCTIDALDEFDEEIRNKFNEVFELFENNHLVHDKMIKMMESLMKTDESLFNYIQDVEETEQFDRDDLYELLTGFFEEEVDESTDSKLPDPEKYPECYWEFWLFWAPCKKAKTCKKEPCKDTCPKKKGRPAKK